MGISPEEMKRYIKDLYFRAQTGFQSITLDLLTSDPIFEWHGSSLSSSLMYNRRHIMVHIGVLQARLLAHGVDEKSWKSFSSTIPRKIERN
jgi:hypothetical protein